MYIDNYCSLCHTFKNSPIHFKSRPIHFKSKKNIFLVVWFTKIIFFYTNVTRGLISCSKIQVFKFCSRIKQIHNSTVNSTIRFQIDQHRERLKERIDHFALAMVDQTKKHEEKFLRDLNERFSLFDESKPLEDTAELIRLSF